MSTEENIAAHKPKDGPQEEVEDFEERVEEKVVLQRTKVLELNAKHFVEKIEQHHGVSIFPGSLDHSLNYQTTWTDLTSPFSHYDSYVFTI